MRVRVATCLVLSIWNAAAVGCLYAALPTTARNHGVMSSSDLDLFSRTSSGEEAHKQLDDARRCAPAYKRGPRSNARVVVQTSISSDEEDLNPPQTRPKMSVDSCRVSASIGPRGISVIARALLRRARVVPHLSVREVSLEIMTLWLQYNTLSLKIMNF